MTFEKALIFTPACHGNSQDPPERPNWQHSTAAAAETFQLWSVSGGACPEGTVPIRRTSQEDMLRASSVQRFGKKVRRHVRRDTSSTGHEVRDLLDIEVAQDSDIIVSLFPSCLCWCSVSLLLFRVFLSFFLSFLFFPIWSNLDSRKSYRMKTGNCFFIFGLCFSDCGFSIFDIMFCLRFPPIFVGYLLPSKQSIFIHFVYKKNSMFFW